MDSRLKSAAALYVFLVLGAFLLVVPWTPVWDDATLRLLPSIGSWLRSGWARGVVSAVGALDLLVALQFAVELWAGPRSDSAGDGGDA